MKTLTRTLAASVVVLIVIAFAVRWESRQEFSGARPAKTVERPFGQAAIAAVDRYLRDQINRSVRPYDPEGNPIGRKRKDTRLEAWGEPVLAPQSHLESHTDGQPNGSPATRHGSGVLELPAALVTVLAHFDDGVVKSYTVVFRSSGLKVFEPSVAGLRSQGSLTMSFRQWERAVSALERFYETALDVERGPERLLPFFSENYLERLARRRGPALSAPELRKWITQVLDSAVLRAWGELEKVPAPSVSDPVPAYLDRYLVERNRFFAAIQAKGAWNQPHRQAVSPYLRRWLGEGMLSISAGPPEHPEAFITFVMTGPTGLLFAEVEGEFRIVAMTMGG